MLYQQHKQVNAMRRWGKTRHPPDHKTNAKIKLNKKLWGEIIAYLPWYDMDRIENEASNNHSIVACAFVAAVTTLPSCYLPTIGVHIETYRAMIGIYEVRHWHSLWCHNIVTYRPTARQRFSKHIPAGANARSNSERISKHASLTTETVFCVVRAKTL
jgi:hypothetical protein